VLQERFLISRDQTEVTVVQVSFDVRDRGVLRVEPLVPLAKQSPPFGRIRLDYLEGFRQSLEEMVPIESTNLFVIGAIRAEEAKAKPRCCRKNQGAEEASATLSGTLTSARSI
jgi:hypothetical protein